MVFGCRPDRGRDTCRNSANASIVSQRLHYQRRFYLRPKFRQLQRLLGPAYNKIATLSLAHAFRSSNVFDNPKRQRGTINLDPVPRSRFLELRFSKFIEIRLIDRVQEPGNQLRSSDSI